jgi:hypothetical protein
LSGRWYYFASALYTVVGYFLLTVHCRVLTPLRNIPEHRYHMQITFWCKHYHIFQWSLRNELSHFWWDWVGTVVDRELDDNYYSEEVRKCWKDAQCYGLRSVEVDLLRIIQGRGWRWWKLGYEDTSLQNDALFYSVLSRSMKNPSGGRASNNRAFDFSRLWSLDNLYIHFFYLLPYQLSAFLTATVFYAQSLLQLAWFMTYDFDSY